MPCTRPYPCHTPNAPVNNCHPNPTLCCPVSLYTILTSLYDTCYLTLSRGSVVAGGRAYWIGLSPTRSQGWHSAKQACKFSFMKGMPWIMSWDSQISSSEERLWCAESWFQDSQPLGVNRWEIFQSHCNLNLLRSLLSLCAGKKLWGTIFGWVMRIVWEVGSDMWQPRNDREVYNPGSIVWSLRSHGCISFRGEKC